MENLLKKIRINSQTIDIKHFTVKNVVKNEGIVNIKAKIKINF